MKIRRSRAVALLAAPLALAGPEPLRAQELPLVKIAAPANDTATSALYAIKAGLFRRAGLNVEIDPMNSGAAVASAVAGNAIQIGNSSLVGIIEAHAKGVPFTLVATSGMIESDVLPAMVVKKDSLHRVARDLNGKRRRVRRCATSTSISMATGSIATV